MSTARPRVADEPAAATIGQRVGSYVLQRRLGRGTSGEVWLGRHVESSGAAAVKLLTSRARRHRHARLFFSRECEVLARLSHPNIAPVFEWGEDFIATAFVDGADLAHVLRTPMPPRRAFDIIAQVAAALSHVHDHGVVHRDVKPGNILVDRDDNAYLVDFGLAIATSAESHADDLLVGTPAYMAPEQHDRALVGPEADQYALARTFIEMLAGQRPPLEREAALAMIPATLPGVAREALARATEPDGWSRWPSIREFLAALAEIAHADDCAPVALAPEQRDEAPFRWVTASCGRDALGPDIERVDFTMAGVEPHLAPGAVDAFNERFGYSAFGWSMYGRPGRLGALDQPAALTRASEVFVLLHGWLATRRSWEPMATLLCRNHAQAVVLVPDLIGFGESTLRKGAGPAELSLHSMGLSVLRWLEMLGVDSIPTVLTGHSLFGSVMLTLRDEEVGPLRSRVALAPAFPMFDDGFRRAGKWLRRLDLLSRVSSRAFRRVCRRLVDRGVITRELPQPTKDALYEVMIAVPPWALAATFSTVADATFASGPQLQRTLIVSGLRDPMVSCDCASRGIEHIGYSPERVQYMSSGGHLPHMETADHPEYTWRNHHELLRHIVSMLHEAETAGAGDLGTLVSSGATPSRSDESLALDDTAVDVSA